MTSGTQSGPSTTVRKGPHPVTVTVEKECAHPGDTQALRVKSAPGGDVLYDTIYADGSNGMTKPRPGSTGTGKADEDGAYRVTWVLAADVPPGRAEVNVYASDGARMVLSTAPFEIAALGKSC